MKEFISSHFDVCIADPEYGIGEHGGKNRSLKRAPQKDGSFKTVKNTIHKDMGWDNQTPSFAYFRELFRVSENQIIFGANYFTEIAGSSFKPPRRDKYEEFIFLNPKGWIIWDKVNGDSDFSDCELIWTSFDINSHVVYYMWNGMMQGVSLSQPFKQQGNKKLNQKRIHPTEKPIFIYIYLIKLFNLKRLKVLDPNMGSNSLGLALHKTFFEGTFVAIENNETYFTSGVNRFYLTTSQLRAI
jgi:site-specific DNA-methyltransferase (adenine-specific)